MRNKKAFTLMELLTVIAVMAVLAGLLLPALRRARQRARTAAAESMIASLQVALSMYNLDYGVYPASTNVTGTQHNGNSFVASVFADDRNNLVAALTDSKRGGPYMEFRGRDLDENPGSPIERRYAVLDPWGRAYVYTARRDFDGEIVRDGELNPHGPYYPDTDNPENNSYNIFSLGPDGRTHNNITATRGNNWNDSGLVTNEECGHWNDPAVTSGSPRYDDINSWDGARR